MTTATSELLDVDVLSLTFAERTHPKDYEAMRFVTKCWNMNGRRGLARRVPDSVYWNEHNGLVLYLARRGFVLMATLPGEPDLYAGFLVGSKHGLDFAFTKSAYRKAGVFGQLLKAAPRHEKFFSCPPGEPDEQGRGGQQWLAEYLNRRGYTYNPFTSLAGVTAGTQEIRP